MEINPERNMKIHTRIEEAREGLKRLENEALETYLVTIRKGYESFGPKQKDIILNELEAFVFHLGRGRIPQVRYSNRKSQHKNDAFDSTKAKNIREMEGISLAGLVGRLGLKRLDAIDISRYEEGIFKPRNPPLGRVNSAYVGWLKEKGYNPFELE